MKGSVAPADFFSNPSIRESDDTKMIIRKGETPKLAGEAFQKSELFIYRPFLKRCSLMFSKSRGFLTKTPCFPPRPGIDEFLRGCLRYRGLATGVDMHTCLRMAPRKHLSSDKTVISQCYMDIENYITIYNIN